MATVNAKNKLKKKLEQLNVAQEKVNELAEITKQAKDEYLIELMGILQTNLETDDLDEIERFVRSVRPLSKSQDQASHMESGAGMEVNHGN